MYVIINKRYVEINHVQPVKKVGAAFPKEGASPIAITAKGRIPYDLSQAGEFCRVHTSWLDGKSDGDAFIYEDGEWVKIDLNTVDFVQRQYK